jgi:L-glyceraldehyde 3-phosphate reductase
MALKDDRITFVLLGASKIRQITDSLRCLDNLTFSADELVSIDAILRG